MFLQNLSIEEKLAYLVIATEVINVDKVLAVEEVQYMQDYMQEMLICDNAADDDENLLSFDVAVSVFVNGSRETKLKVYMELYALVICDSIYAEEEKKILRKLQKLFEINDAKERQLENCIDELRKVYKQMENVLNE